MNPILAAIAALSLFKKELKEKFNEQLAKLRPIEQQEVGEPVRNILWSVDWAARRLDELGKEVDETVANAEAIYAEMQNKAGTAAIAAAIEAKTHLTVVDHEAALTAATTEVETRLTADFTARLEGAKTVFDRRADAIAKIGALAAATLSDADLAATDHADRVAVLVARLATLKEAGIEPETKAKVFASLIAHGIDDAGKQAFDTQFEVLKEAAGGSFTAKKEELPKGPRPPGGQPPSGGDPAGKKSVI